MICWSLFVVLRLRVQLNVWKLNLNRASNISGGDCDCRDDGACRSLVLLASCIWYYLIRNINLTLFSEIFPEAEPTPHLWTSQLKEGDVLTSRSHSAHLWQQPLCLLLFQHHITMNKHAADILDWRDSCRLMKTHCCEPAAVHRSELKDPCVGLCWVKD